MATQNYSLERLAKEPELLDEQQRHVQRQLLASAVQHSPAFVGSASCLRTIDAELACVGHRLDDLMQDIPGLVSSCEAFSLQSTAVLEQHAQNKLLAREQSTLLELLEVPQLMNTCVRNGVYDEALDLQAFVGRLALLHPEVPVVRMLIAQVMAVGHTMLQQLLARLRASLQLPECLRIMGYLRRMAVLSEADLRLQFLQCRDDWISGLVEELDDAGDAYEHVKHLTDIHRLHLFDAVMQFRAIFLGANAPTAGAAAAVQGNPAALVASVRESAVLHSWVQHRLSLYMSMLQAHLPRIAEGSSLTSVLEHCMFCGASLSRVGLDFQGLLQPLFEGCVLSQLSQHLASAIEVFSARLESHKWVAMPIPLPPQARQQPPPPQQQQQQQQQHQGAGSSSSGGELGETWAGAGQEGGGAGARAGANVGGSESGAAAAIGGGAGASGEEWAPPYAIMQHAPLALLTNGMLTALNELRHCALLGVARPAAGVMQESLEAVAASLLHYHHTRALADGEAAVFAAAAQAMLDTVVPYLASCFARVFVIAGGASAAKLDWAGTATILRTLLQGS